MKLFINALFIIFIIQFGCEPKGLAQGDSNGSFTTEGKKGGEPLKGCVRILSDSSLDIKFNFSYFPPSQFTYIDYFVKIKVYDQWRNQVQTDNFYSPSDYMELDWDASIMGYSGYKQFNILDSSYSCFYYFEFQVYGIKGNAEESIKLDSYFEHIFYRCGLDDHCYGYLQAHGGGDKKGEINENHTFLVLPNPFVSDIEFQFSDFPSKINLYNTSGILISHCTEIDELMGFKNYISNLEPGYYILNIQYPNMVLNKKLIKR